MRQTAFFGIIVLLFLGSVTSVFALHFETRSEQRNQARERWSAQALSDYRIALHIDVMGTDCFQELEVRGSEVTATVRDTCKRTWVGKMTVERLFTWSQRSAPQSYCYPASDLCACRRVSFGSVDYNPTLGYPQHIEFQREIRANPINKDYWLLSWESRNLGICRPMTQHVSVTVLALTPLH